VSFFLLTRIFREQYEDAHYMRLWFNHTELVAAKKSEKHGGGKLVWRFPVQKEYLNFMKQYAGGAQAVVHDVCTAWTLLTVSQPGWGSLGMSRTLNMSYLKTASAGDVLLLKCEVREHCSVNWLRVRRERIRADLGCVADCTDRITYGNDSRGA
jgi:acyl-coenzyme A thioesterase PaaI-like protein